MFYTVDCVIFTKRTSKFMISYAQFDGYIILFLHYCYKGGNKLINETYMVA
jgi:hypothetical protein